MRDARKLFAPALLGFLAAALCSSDAGANTFQYDLAVQGSGEIRSPLSALPVSDTLISTAPVPYLYYNEPSGPSGYGTGSYLSTDSAQAGYGFVGSSSYVSLSYPITPYYGSYTLAYTGFVTASMNDLYLVGPFGQTVNYSLNLSVAGSLGGSGEWSSTAYFSGGTNDGASGCAAGVTGTISSDFVTGLTGTGIFSGGPNWSGATPNVCTGVNGDNISVNLQLDTTAYAQLEGAENGDAGIYSDANIDYYDPAMFSDIGPLFNFSAPDWTVDSTNGCVVNNRYLCAPSAVSSAPEPGSLVLLGTAIAGIGLLRRRQSNRGLSRLDRA
jgi:PEP-CTERM motif